MKKILAILAITAFTFSLPACKSKMKDADVKASAETALAGNPDFNGLMVDVKDGVATISGEVKDASVQSAAQTAVGSVKGVKSVQNSTTVAPPPPPATPTTAPVISADDALTKGVADALKDYPTVKATVKDGVVSVTGQSSAANWKKIKMALDALHPKKVDASALTIK